MYDSFVPRECLYGGGKLGRGMSTVRGWTVFCVFYNYGKKVPEKEFFTSSSSSGITVDFYEMVYELRGK